DRHGRAPLVDVPADDGDLVGERGDLVEEGGELARRVAVVERGDELDGLADVLEVRPELRGDGVVQHGSSTCGAWRGVRQGERRGGREEERPGWRWGRPPAVTGAGPTVDGVSGVRSSRRGPATGRGSRHPPPTSPGTPRSGAPGRTGRPCSSGAARPRCGRRPRG